MQTDLDQKIWPRAINYSPRHNLIYVTNQKAACTTLKTLMARMESEDHDYSPDSSIHKESPLQGLRDLGQERARKLLSGEARVFTFIREPAKRCVSAYFEKIALKDHGGKFRREIKIVLGKEDQRGVVTFDEFLDALETQDPHLQNPHWRSQHLNIMHDFVKYDFIGRLEKFNDHWEELCGLLQLPKLPALKKHAVTPKAAQDELLTDKNRARIKKIYQKDYELFGY